jgi:hypothetical protein
MALVVKDNAASLAKPMDFSVAGHRPVVAVEFAARSGAHVHCVRKTSAVVGVRQSEKIEPASGRIAAPVKSWTPMCDSVRA